MSAPVVTPSVDLRELATILAALRFYQNQGFGLRQERPAQIQDIATDCGTLKPLSPDEIDDLCLKLNTQ